MKKITTGVLAILCLAGCKQNGVVSDATGAFETVETILSAEATGTLKQFHIEEGQILKEGENIGFVDTVQLYLKKKQLETQIGSTLSELPDIPAQLAALQIQLESARRDSARYANLVREGVATKKQLDDAVTQVFVFQKQIEASNSILGISTKKIRTNTNPLAVQIAQMNDQLKKSYIVAPMNGTVLVKYAQQNEMVIPGKALYKIADISALILRAYITGMQLPQIKLNQSVKVLVDNGSKDFKTYDGVITWISDKAEFTPKTILTKEERADLVYAIKIKVPNEKGELKIGEYAEVKF